MSVLLSRLDVFAEGGEKVDLESLVYESRSVPFSRYSTSHICPVCLVIERN